MIQDCALIYKNLLRKKFILTLENGAVFSLVFSAENFKHLAGLHKLTDLPQIKNSNSRKLFKQALKNENNINSILPKSVHFHSIEERLLYFHIIPELLQNKIIVNFDSSIVQTNSPSKLTNSDYMLYKRLSNDGIAHLTLIQYREGMYKPETFFVEHSNIYLSNQELLDIVSVVIQNFD